MSRVADDILMHYGVGKLDGAPGRGSGRYELGSGENPNQHGGNFYTRVQTFRKENPNYTFYDEDTGKTYTGDSAIAKSWGMSTTEFRTELSLARNELRAENVATAKRLRDEGLNTSEIAREMGYSNESSVRNLLKESSEVKMNEAQVTADFIKKQVDEKGMIDVGVGVEKERGVSRQTFDEALYLLEKEGYPVYSGRMPQVTNSAGKQTTLKVICPPGTKHKEIYNYGDIHSLANYTSNTSSDGSKPTGFVYPKSMDSSRIQIRYSDDEPSGKEKDGVIEIRRGVEDLSLGNSHYAQVRILVDDDHYLKGMAMYSDDLPDGVDIIFNTNKTSDVPKMDVLKEISKDPDNPFGSTIKSPVVDRNTGEVIREGGQSYYTDSNGESQLSLINKTREEGDWTTWSNNLPAQFLSKQSKQLIEKQLNLAKADKEQEFEEICALTNPTVKRQMLNTFADDCDSAAIHLTAAALPRQKYQVILPLTTISENEVYAPNYENGETVALIRYPHGGTFEIPILKVNNKLSEGQEVLGNTPLDAIGINTTVAERLSGADFDGDTVMVIPCNSSSSKIKIVSTDPNTDPDFKKLQGFEPKVEYAADYVTTDDDGTKHYYRNGQEYKTLSKGSVQNEMGRISNLITDMTLAGAPNSEIVRAVKHSMVIIDAYKHHLDYKQSYVDNNIAALKRKYQGRTENGRYTESAATLISRAGAEITVPKRQGTPTVDKETGEKTYKISENLNYTMAKVVKKSDEGSNATIHISDSGKNYVQFDGDDTWVPMDGTRKVSDGDRVQAELVTKERGQKSTQMAETTDAHLLSSGTIPEELYADYANEMKVLGNEARKEAMATGKIVYSPSAAKTYASEVDSLKTKLSVAQMNAPRERQAQAIANSVVTAKKQDNPDMTREEVKKASQQALTQARIQVGASRTPIEITDEEWEAIQAGAIHDNTLSQILKYTDTEVLRQKATPRATTTISATQRNKIKAMGASGYTIKEIADALNLPESTIRKYLKE